MNFKYAICVTDWIHSKKGNLVLYFRGNTIIYYTCVKCSDQQGHTWKVKSASKDIDVDLCSATMDDFWQHFERCTSEEVKQYMLEQL